MVSPKRRGRAPKRDTTSGCVLKPETYEALVRLCAPGESPASRLERLFGLEAKRPGRPFVHLSRRLVAHIDAHWEGESRTSAVEQKIQEEISNAVAAVPEI